MAGVERLVRTLKDVLGHNGPVRCECGRTTNADMVADLAGLPAAQRPDGRLVMCDACRERLRLQDPQRHAALMVRLAARP